MMKNKSILFFGLVLLSFGGSENNLTDSVGNEDLVKAINEIKANYQELKNKIIELDNKMQVLQVIFIRNWQQPVITNTY